MKFNGLLKKAIFLQRKCENIVEVDSDGEKLAIYCPNYNKLSNCAMLGSRVWYSPAEYMPIYKPATWQLAEVDYGKLVLVNDNICRDLFLEGLKNKKIKINNLDIKKAVIKLDSNLFSKYNYDFKIKEDKKNDIYLSVSSSSLADEQPSINSSLSYFPEESYIDKREELYNLIAAKMFGHRAVLCCFVLTEGSKELCLTNIYNTEYAELLKIAIETGVEFIAYNIDITEEKLQVSEKVRVISEGLGVHI